MKKEGLWIHGDRYEIDIARSRAFADLRDRKGRGFIMMTVADLEDLLDLVAHVRAGDLWGRSGRFASDMDPDGFPAVIDQKHSVRMARLTTDDLAELEGISSRAVVEMA